MRLILFLAGFISLSISLYGQNTIYSFELDSIAGSSKIRFSDFQGKKILIVNGASQDSAFGQYEELKQLYQLYKDSLMIVVVPSNSFGTEPGGNNQIAQNYMQQSQDVFPVSRKQNVRNPDIHPVYTWLTTQSLNGLMNSEVSKPWFKYIINKNGELRGVYGQKITPMSSVLRHAIETVQ